MSADRLLTALEHDHPETDSWQPINLADLPPKPPVQPTLGHTSLLYPGKRHVFSGPPESAKTLAAYTMLILVARTGAQGVLIDFEMGAYDARQRLRELGATDDELARILFLEPEDRATLTHIDELADHDPSLVVIDAAVGAYTLEGLDDNKGVDVERFAALYVKRFWRREIATIVIDHVVKDAEHRGRWLTGSQRKLGAIDVHFGFETIKAISRGTDGRYKLLCHKDRAGYHKRGHLADLRLDSDTDTHAMAWTYTTATEATTGEGGYFRPTHLMEKVSVNLELRHEPCTRNNVYDAIGGTKDYVLKAITALVNEHFLTEQDGPNRSKLLTSARPYREATDQEPDGTGQPAPTAHILASSSNGHQNIDLTPEPVPGWFTPDGNLADSPDLAYLASIEPDPDEGPG